MIIGIGCDLVNIIRIENVMKHWGGKFLARIFTEREVRSAPCLREKDVLYFSYFAKRFAAKEAYIKAFGRTRTSRMAFRDIEIASMSNGCPYFVGQPNVHLSMSDEYPFAMAYVVATECKR